MSGVARGARYALLVANATYSEPKFQRLRAPAHDVAALARVLCDPEIGAFDVSTLVDEQSWSVSEQIEGFFADRNRDDLLLLYFSCHGVKDAAGRLHFATTNTRFDRLGSTGISSAWVNEQLDRSLSRRIVLLLDCCYSGAYARGLAPRADEAVHVVERFQGRGRAIITASDAMEYAYEGDELSRDAGQPSVFTRALVRGLETGAADRDGDGRVALSELHSYVYDEVREVTPHQTPTMSVHGLQGELYLAKNPHPPAPPVELVPLPFELRQALESELGWQREGAVAGLKRLLDSDRPGLALSARNALERLATDDDAQVRAVASAAFAPAEPIAPAPEVTVPPPKAAPPADRPAASLRSQTPVRTHAQEPQRQGERAAPAAGSRTIWALVGVGFTGCIAFSQGNTPQLAVLLLLAGLAVGAVRSVTRSPRSSSRLAGCGLLVGIGLTMILESVKHLNDGSPPSPVAMLLGASTVLAGAATAVRMLHKAGMLGWRAPLGKGESGLVGALALASVVTSILSNRDVLSFSLDLGPWESMAANAAWAAPAVVVPLLLSLAQPGRFAGVALTSWVVGWLGTTLVFDLPNAIANGKVNSGTIVLQLLAFAAIAAIGLYRALGSGTLTGRRATRRPRRPEEGSRGWSCRR